MCLNFFTTKINLSQTDLIGNHRNSVCLPYFSPYVGSFTPCSQRTHHLPSRSCVIGRNIKYETWLAYSTSTWTDIAPLIMFGLANLKSARVCLLSCDLCSMVSFGQPILPPGHDASMTQRGRIGRYSGGFPAPSHLSLSTPRGLCITFVYLRRFLIAKHRCIKLEFSA